MDNDASGYKFHISLQISLLKVDFSVWHKSYIIVTVS